jgi:predicted ATPase
MPVREARDRRGRSARGSSGLVERDAALRAIEVVVDNTHDGAGEALLIEGHAGMGKSRLHEAAVDLARARGMRVLRTADAELERSIAFGVTAQLMRAQLLDLPASRRRSLLASAPERVLALAGTQDTRSKQRRRPRPVTQSVHAAGDGGRETARARRDR